MPSIVYDGPHPEVGFVAADGSRVVAEKGKAVEVDAETARSLTEQEHFRSASEKAETKADLEERAKALDIEGYSDLNKAELKSAVEAAERNES